MRRRVEARLLLAAAVLLGLLGIGAASVWVSGSDDRSQIPLGLTGADMAILKPVDTSIFGGVGIKKFIAAFDYSMFLLDDGSLFVSGRNEEGQLGLGDYLPRFNLTRVTLTGTAATVADMDGCRGNAVLLLSDGTAWVAGANDVGQLGLGDPVALVNVFTQVPGLSSVTHVACSSPNGYGNNERNLFFVVNRQDIWSTGSSGRPGIDPTPSSLSPSQIADSSCWTGKGGIKQITSRVAASIYIITNDGTICAWGDNDGGQLGNGNNVFSATPVQTTKTWDVAVDGYPEDIQAGEWTLMRTSNNSVFMWGWNVASLLDSSGPGSYLVPTKMNLTKYNAGAALSAISVSKQQIHLIFANGKAWGTGISWNGEMCMEAWDIYGGGERDTACHLPTGAGGYVAASTGRDSGSDSGFSLYLMQSGKIYANGPNSYGQTGAGATHLSQAVPTPATFTSPLDGNAIKFVSIAIGYRATLALDAQGSIYATGETPYLGADPTATVKTTKTLVSGALWAATSFINITSNIYSLGASYKVRIADIAAGREVSLARNLNGVVFSWGSNPGRSTATYSTNVPGMMSFTTFGINANISRMSCGWGQCLFWSSSNRKMFGFGSTEFGELGYVSTTAESLPIELTAFNGMIGANTDVAQIDAGFFGTAILLTNGSVIYCGTGSWGMNPVGLVNSAWVPVAPPIFVDLSSIPTKVVKVGFSKGDQAPHISFLTTDGKLYGYGTNGNGQIGDLYGSNDWYATMRESTAINNNYVVKDMAVGSGWVVAVTTDGSAIGWGYPGFGTLGTGVFTQARADLTALTPAIFPPGYSVDSVSSGPSSIAFIATYVAPPVSVPAMAPTAVPVSPPALPTPVMGSTPTEAPASAPTEAPLTTPTNTTVGTAATPTAVEGISGGVVAAAVAVPTAAVAGIAAFAIFCFVLPRRRRAQQQQQQTKSAEMEEGKSPAPAGGAAVTYGALPESRTAANAGGNSTYTAMGIEDSSEEDRKAVAKRRQTVSQIAVEGFKSEWMIPFSDLTFGKKLGQGAFGIVYRGKWCNTRCAIKQSTISQLEPEALAAFKKEAILMLGIRPHPNVVQVLGISVNEGNIYVILTYCEKGSLDSKFGSGELTLDQKLHILAGVAAGCRHLHQYNVVHRDLAARNVLLDASNVPKISDFGMSRLVDEFEVKGQTASNVGPLKYMAPESLTNREYSFASDVYTFGIVVIELLTEKPPFPDVDLLDAALKITKEGLTPDIPKDCPQWLADLCKACWDRNPAKRPTFKAIEEAFAAHLGTDQESSDDSSTSSSSNS